MDQNPLSKYYRQPALYLKLPSEGKFWPQGSIEMPPNGEIPVLPMSGKDDIAMRNADGLMNGATTVSVIQSCCPNIKDAWQTPSVDLDAILIAIRMASYGNIMDFDTKCANCKEDMSYSADLSAVLNEIHAPDFSKGKDINGLLVGFRPNSYLDFNATNQERYIQQRTVRMLQDSNLSEDEKLDKVKQAVFEITERTVERVAGFIEYIITPEGVKVIDEDFIKEFVLNADQATYNLLRDSIFEYNKEYTIKPMNIKCSACGHEDTRQFQFEPASFFG